MKQINVNGHQSYKVHESAGFLFAWRYVAKETSYNPVFICLYFVIIALRVMDTLVPN